MNKPKATKAKPSARLDNPLTPKGALTCTIDVMALRGMTMSELRALRDALHTTHNVLSAFSCQPRFDGSSHHCKNAAGNLLEVISEWIASCEQAVVNVASGNAGDRKRC